jgi:hypothetical protein
VKALWAEDHGFTWFSVMDHVIQIPPVDAPDEVGQKFARLRRHCETEHRSYEAIERTNVTSLLLARND